MRGVVVAKATVLGLSKLRVIRVARAAVDVRALAKFELLVGDRDAAKVRVEFDGLLVLDRLVPNGVVSGLVLITFCMILLIFVVAFVMAGFFVVLAALFVIPITLGVFAAFEVAKVVLCVTFLVVLSALLVIDLIFRVEITAKVILKRFFEWLMGIKTRNA